MAFGSYTYFNKFSRENDTSDPFLENFQQHHFILYKIKHIIIK